MSELSQQGCVPCRGSEEPLSREQAESKLSELQGWEIIERGGSPRLRKRYDFPDFRSALAFTERVGEEAEQQGHHPRIVTQWGRVGLDWWTHAIGGLHNNDFIMAARADRLYAEG
jgi:4a-hydroxytetrahydrobiopterin dehydratase